MVQTCGGQISYYNLALLVGSHAHIPTRDNRISVFSCGKGLSECIVSDLSSNYCLYLEQLEQPGSRLSHFLFRCLQAAQACNAVPDNDVLAENERIFHSHCVQIKQYKFYGQRIYYQDIVMRAMLGAYKSAPRPAADRNNY